MSDISDANETTLDEDLELARNDESIALSKGDAVKWVQQRRNKISELIRMKKSLEEQLHVLQTKLIKIPIQIETIKEDIATVIQFIGKVENRPRSPVPGSNTGDSDAQIAIENFREQVKVRLTGGYCSWKYNKSDAVEVRKASPSAVTGDDFCSRKIHKIKGENMPYCKKHCIENGLLGEGKKVANEEI